MRVPYLQTHDITGGFCFTGSHEQLQPSLKVRLFMANCFGKPVHPSGNHIHEFHVRCKGTQLPLSSLLRHILGYGHTKHTQTCFPEIVRLQAWKEMTVYWKVFVHSRENLSVFKPEGHRHAECHIFQIVCFLTPVLRLCGTDVAKETQDSHDKNSFHDLHVFVNIDILY